MLHIFAYASVRICMFLALFMGFQVLTCKSQHIQSFAFTSGIDKIMPVDSRKVFSVGEKVWAWIRLRDFTPGDSIFVEWYSDDKLVYTQRLPVGYRNMRTYCYKNLRRPGVWSIIIRSSQDEVLLADSVLVE